MAFPDQSTHPILEIEDILIVSTDGLEVGQIVGQMLFQRSLQSTAVWRKNTDSLELFFSHDPFQTLAGHSLVRGMQRNISQPVCLIEAISAAIAARNVRFAVFGAFGSKNGQNHMNLSAAAVGPVSFELLQISENLGAIEPRRAQNLDRLRKITARDEAAH